MSFMNALVAGVSGAADAGKTYIDKTIDQERAEAKEALVHEYRMTERRFAADENMKGREFTANKNVDLEDVRHGNAMERAKFSADNKTSKPQDIQFRDIVEGVDESGIEIKKTYAVIDGRLIPAEELKGSMVGRASEAGVPPGALELAQQAIAAGADPSKVAERYKSVTGEDFPNGGDSPEVTPAPKSFLDEVTAQQSTQDSKVAKRVEATEAKQEEKDTKAALRAIGGQFNVAVQDPVKAAELFEKIKTLAPKLSGEDRKSAIGMATSLKSIMDGQ